MVRIFTDQPDTKSRMLLPAHRQSTPEQCFRHIRVTGAVRVRKSIPTRRSSPATGCQCGTVILQRIAYIVQPERMRNRGIYQRRYMTPRCYGSPVAVNAMLSCQLADFICRNMFHNLFQYCRFMPSRFYGGPFVLICGKTTTCCVPTHFPR